MDGHDLIPTWCKQGLASLRASQLRQVEPDVPRDELKEIINLDYSQASYAAKAAKVDECHAFLPAEYRESTDGLSNLRRDVAWADGSVNYGDLPGDVVARLQIQYDVIEMTQQLPVLEKLLATLQDVGEDESDGGASRRAVDVVLPDASEALGHELNVDRERLQECIELLRDRPHLIFYGPPGRGKTFIAQHLAGELAGDNVRLVQFHPGYSYEDFLRGLSALGGGEFRLKPRPLRKLVDAARKPGDPLRAHH